MSFNCLLLPVSNSTPCHEKLPYKKEKRAKVFIKLPVVVFGIKNKAVSAEVILIRVLPVPSAGVCNLQL